MPEGPLVIAREAAQRERGGPVVLRGVAKSFDGRPVLRDMSLSIAPGSFVAVVGRSGCGKSTLLRLIAGLEPASAGEVFVCGAPARRGGARHSRIMFQEPRLLPWARVAANVTVGLPDGDGAARVAQVLAQVALADRAAAWPSVLSGGQKQRVALARALVGRPRLLALDEPLGALDALTRLEMQALIEQCWLDQGFTALLVTHDVDEAVALADRVLLLENGGIAEDVPVDLPRPRRHGDPEAARIAGNILARLLRAT